MAACQFVAEVGIFEPTVDSAFSDAGGAGGLGQGGSGGDDRQYGLGARGEAGNFSFPLISSHFLPFGGCFESPFDRAQDRLNANGGEVLRLRG